MPIRSRTGWPQLSKPGPIPAFAGTSIVVRAGWKSLHWLGAGGEPLDILAELEKESAHGQVDRPVWIGRKGGPALGLRLIAVKKPPTDALARL